MLLSPHFVYDFPQIFCDMKQVKRDLMIGIGDTV